MRASTSSGTSQVSEVMPAAADAALAPTGFTPDSEVIVRQLDDPELKWQVWELRHRLEYLAKKDSFVVDAGLHTDFASIPRIFVWLLPRYGRYTRAAILHDHLWACARKGEISYHDADGVFRQAMRRLEVPLLRRWTMWAAVRWASLFKRKPEGWWRELRAWLRDAPGVLLITLVMLPVVAVPAVLILAALALFFVLESIVWVALHVGRALRRLAGRPPTKKINRPSFDWTLS